jgi:His-Xaa-Ser system protein HxsD
LGGRPREEEQAERIVAAFKNEVLDQDLRSIISKETEAIRNAVLAFALSKTGLQGGE